MIIKYQKKYSTWIDVSLPHRDEVDAIMREYSIDSVVGRDLLHPTPKPKVLAINDKIYTVFHIPVFKNSHAPGASSQEIDFVIGRKILISVRYDTIDALYKYTKEVEVKELLDREDGGDHVFVDIMVEIYKSLFDELSFIEDRLSEIEKRIFRGEEKQMVERISEAGRDLLNFRRIIEPHGDMLHDLRLLGVEVLGKKFNGEMDALIDEWQRLLKTIDNHRNFISELRETNNSLLSTKQNEIMKTLTIMAFVTFPLTLITSIFGMEIDNKPLVDAPHAFWIIIAGMVALTACFFLFFKYKKWL